MADDPKPTTPLQSAVNYWAHTAALLLGLIATAVGIYASISSHTASNQADAAGAQAKVNSDRLNDLQYKLVAATTFATGIHEARDALAEKNRGVPAMVEVSRLYAVATTAQQKLVLIQIAQLAKQQAALSALSTLVANDPDLQPPYTDANRGSVAAINRIVRDATVQIAVSQTPQPKPAKLAPHAPTAPPDDPALTASTNHLVAASAALAASLPKTESEQGWIFVGDVDGWGPDAERRSATLIPGTATTSSAVVPLPGTAVIACRDLNIRVVPFLDDALGAVTGIVSAGTELAVDNPPKPYPARIDAYRTLGRRSKREITARWVHVSVAAAVAKPTSAPSPGDHKAPATPVPTSKPVNFGACTAAPGTQSLLL